MDIKRDKLFLIVNLASEVSKVISGRKNSDVLVFNMAKEKISKIIDEVKQIEKNKEIFILEDVIRDLLSDNPKYKIKENNLKSYFLPFLQVFSRRLNN